MRNLPEFLYAILGYWRVLIVGIVLSGALFALRWWLPQSRKIILAGVPGVIFILFVTSSCFFAWRDQYKARQELAVIKPALKLEIVRSIFGEMGKIKSGFQIVVGVKNVGKMQSVTGGWELSLIDPSGKPVDIEHVYIAGPVTIRAKNGGLDTIDEADMIHAKTFNNPVLPGGYVQGVMYGVAKDLQAEDLKRQQYVLIVKCSDALNTPIEARSRIIQFHTNLERMPALSTQRLNSNKLNR